MDVTKVLSLWSLSKSRDSLNCLSLSLARLSIFFLLHWAHTLYLPYTIWDGERKKCFQGKLAGRQSTFYLWPVKKLQKSPFSLLRSCFSLSLSTIFGRVRGRQIIRGGRVNTKVYTDVCGFSFFWWVTCHRLSKESSQKAHPHCVCKQRSGCYGLLKRLETSSAGWRMNRSHLSASFCP